MEKRKPQTVEEYILGCPEAIQPLLQQLRKTIADAAPEATEKISWGMATFFLHGNLVHFSAEKKHIGFHPDPSAILAFSKELEPYSSSKGTVRFPYDKPLPWELIHRMVAFRVEENKHRVEEKKIGKQSPIAEEKPAREMPEEMKTLLEQKGLMTVYGQRPTYQRNAYLEWIFRGKREETRQKRMAQMLAELQSGDRYMAKPYVVQKRKDGDPATEA